MSKVRIEREAPSAEAMEIAKAELRESPELVKESLEKLRELMSGEPKLNYRTDDEFLTIFLRPCKWYPESALALMKSIADFRLKYADSLKDLTPESEKAGLCDYKIVNVMAERDAKGRRVLIANIGSAWDTKNISGDSIFRMLYMIHLAAILEPETQCRGSVVILDFDGLGMKQVAQLTPGFSLRLLSFIQDALPLRLKEVHIVKQPFIFNLVWKVFQPFVKEKLKNRLFFHGSKMDSLHKHMDPAALPADYGGKRPKMDYSSVDWYPILYSLNDKIIEWQDYGWKK